jgi:hypothetical protein
MFAVLACLGLWSRTRWGWWLVLLNNIVGLGTFLWGATDQKVRPDADELAFFIASKRILWDTIQLLVANC